MASVDTTSQSWGVGANLTFQSFGPPVDRCKNEHPRQGFSSGNRFGALSGGGFGTLIVLCLILELVVYQYEMHAMSLFVSSLFC